MRKRNSRKLWLLIGVLALTSIMCSTSGGAEVESPKEEFSAAFTEVNGTVQVKLGETDDLLDAELDQTIVENDQVYTYTSSTATLTLTSGSIIRLVPNTSFVLQRMENGSKDPLTRLDLMLGEVWIILNGGTIEVDTPAGLASVRGSFMSVRVAPDSNQTTVTCLEGHCRVANNIGAIDMIAGQKAELVDLDTAPTAGLMTDDDVARWLEYNPEASDQLPQLTATVGALFDQAQNPSCDVPTGWALVILQADDNLITVAARHGIAADELAVGNCLDSNIVLQAGDVIFAPPAPTPTAVICGPPDGWVLYIIQTGDTLESVASAYRVSTAELQEAACLGDLTILFEGNPLYVPDVATTTPTPTSTAVPTKTTVPATAIPATAVPTATLTATPVPVNPTTFTAASGPVTGSIATCTNTYSIDVTDLDGISFVKVEYSLNGAGFPGTTVLLTNSGATWSGSFSITTTAGDTVDWRFWAGDSLGNSAYSPASGGYSYSDPLGCP